MTDANHQFIENHEFLRELGIAIEDQEEGMVRLSLPYRESLANPAGTAAMQGGVVATLIDHAGGAAIRTMLDDPWEVGHGTTDLNVTYVRPATGDLTAEATVVRCGQTMGVVQVEVTSDTQRGKKTVAVGRVSLHLRRE